MSLEQNVQRSCRCPDPGDLWSPEQLDLVGGNPAHSSGVGTRWSLRSLSTQGILWVYDWLYNVEFFKNTDSRNCTCRIYFIYNTQNILIYSNSFQLFSAKFHLGCSSHLLVLYTPPNLLEPDNLFLVTSQSKYLLQVSLIFFSIMSFIHILCLDFLLIWLSNYRLKTLSEDHSTLFECDSKNSVTHIHTLYLRSRNFLV